MIGHAPTVATPAGASPSPHTVKQAICDGDVTRSTGVALALVIVDVAAYIATIVLVLRAPWWPVRLAAAIAAGLCLAILFILAHDACHGSLTPSSRLNAILGRLCFLPSLFPLSPWEHGHNRLHHGWTNLKGKDYGWRPLSVAEYRALAPVRRLLERAYRTTAGVALYGIVAIWWTHMMILTEEDRRWIDPLARRIDRTLIIAYGCASVVVVAQAGADAVLLALVLPWLVFHWLFGTVTLLHHTHPQTRWFASRAEWSFYDGQIRNTVHVIFPRVVELVLHNITVHGAHHADPKVPLYKLRNAQARLEQAFPSDVIVVRWSLSAQRSVLRTCRLYDYERHQWLDFDGTPTSPPIR